MCTAIFDSKFGLYFGRTLDLECSFGERVMRVGRGEALRFIHMGELICKHSIIGMAYDSGAQPLFYDAVNDAGLCAAALNFPNYAKYRDSRGGALNLASFELIPYLLSQFSGLSEVKNALENTFITRDDFSPELKSTPLHWMLADRSGAIVIEQGEDGLRVYNNSFGVMTNSPPFPYHQARICDFSYLSPSPQENRLMPNHDLTPYSRGLGAYGLPGDFSSSSRFVRALFAKEHTTIPSCDDASQSTHAARQRIFDILGTVSLPYGIARTDDGKPIYTVYTSCIDIEKREYSYFTFWNREIRSVKF